MAGSCDGEVWLAWVAFDSAPGDGKERPIVVTRKASNRIYYYQCTSHAPRGNDDYQLQDWADAHLDKPTVVRLGRLAVADTENLIHRIGSLSDRDRKQVTKLSRKRKN